MRKRIRTTALLVSIILFGIGQFACVSDVDSFNLPESNPKLVVQSFICPGDSIKVTVQSSKPYYYNQTQQGDGWDWEFDWVTNAVVTIRSITTNVSHTIPFIDSINTYVIVPSEFSIEAGNEYELNVSAPGLSPVRATTTVPSGVPTISNIKIVSQSGNQSNDYTIRVTGNINDIAGQSNFYSLLSYEFITYTWEEDSYSSLQNFNRVLLTDTNKDGEAISFRTEINVYGEPSQHSEARIMILSTDEHYYKFHKSLATIYDVMDNPFAESTHLYSNVEGGLGVFGSFIYVFTESFTKNPEP